MKKYAIILGLMFCAGSYATAQTAQTEKPQQTTSSTSSAILTPANAPASLASSQAAAAPEVKGKEAATVASGAAAQLPSEAAAPAPTVSAAPVSTPQLASEKSAAVEAAAPKSEK